MDNRCDLVLPCRDEGPALPALLAKVPAVLSVIVVDNGSTDDTAEVAEANGARVVSEPRPGYGAAVHAGVLASDAEYLAVMDGDGSMDPRDLVYLLDVVVRGGATMAVGRRRPVGRGSWPWHARLGNTVVSSWVRRRTSIRVHDIAPMRVVRREDLLVLDVQDRRFGYPLELLVKAGQAGWAVEELDIGYYPRSPGTTSKVSGSATGTVRAVRDFAKVFP